MKESKIIKCFCGAEGLQVTTDVSLYDNDKRFHKSIQISFWSIGCGRKVGTWRWRVWYAWHVFIGKPLWNDMIELDEVSARQFADALHEAIDYIPTKEDKL